MRKMKCMDCGKETQIKTEDGKEYYICSEGHKNSRMILNKGLEHYNEEGEIVHVSVGAVIVKSGKILLLNRRKYPFKYTIPAGHLEEGENPEKAIIREVKEETNLEISAPELKLEEKVEDPCRRGADYHYWYLYTKTVEEPVEVSTNDEASDFRWVDPSELKKIELTEPTKHFLIDKQFQDF